MRQSIKTRVVKDRTPGVDAERTVGEVWMRKGGSSRRRPRGEWEWGTNFHRICEAQTPGNSLNVGLCAECAYGRGASDRHRLKVHLRNGLCYEEGQRWKLCHGRLQSRVQQLLDDE